MPVTATELTGTIVDGRVELDAPARLPNGTRVNVSVPALADEDDLGPPPDTHDRATELAILRESHADALAGRTRPFEEVMAEIKARYNLPDLDEE